MAAAAPTPPADLAEVERVLLRLLPGGELLRIPKHPRQRDILLALLADGLERRRPYAEAELNDWLQERLGTLNARVDHVTARRYLIDCDYVKRDRAGQRYFVNYPRLEQAVTAAALAERSRLVSDAIAWHHARERQRDLRRAAHGGSQQDDQRGAHGD